MRRRQWLVRLVVAASVALPTAAWAQLRAADGVTLNDEGLPQYSTFSLCAIDPATGQSGAAVTTRVPFVGRAVPHVRAGIGAVCTQASTDGRVRAARAGSCWPRASSRRRCCSSCCPTDAQRESRQVGVINMKGRRRRAHRQEQRQLGWQPAGPELHGAGQHHGRPRSRRRGRGDVRIDRRARACRSPSA